MSTNCENCGVNKVLPESEICIECAPNEAFDYVEELELMGLSND